MKLLLGILLLTAFWRADGQQDCFGEGTFGTDINTAKVNEGAENFGLKVFANIAKDYSTASFIMSPYSIWSVLKLAYYGSAGVTETELKAALGVPSKRDAFWASHLTQLRRKVAKDTAMSNFDQAYFANDVSLRQCAIGKVVGIKILDFRRPSEAAESINKDISNATNGEIRDFVNGNYISKARFILINALYFKGKWVNQFDKTKTAPENFFDESGIRAKKSKAVMMEAQAKFNYGKSSVLKAEVVELPYEQTTFKMLIVLPDEGQSVNNVLSLLSSSTLKTLTKSLKSNNIINLKLPAFNFTTKIDRLLRESLNALQINTLFDPTQADLSAFVPDETLAVSNALHQATIRVDEEGTVAAAATGLVVTRTGAERIINFTANRPFLFMIRDTALDITFFIGVYRDPAHSVSA